MWNIIYKSTLAYTCWRIRPSVPVNKPKGQKRKCILMRGFIEWVHIVFPDMQSGRNPDWQKIKCQIITFNILLYFNFWTSEPLILTSICWTIISIDLFCSHCDFCTVIPKPSATASEFSRFSSQTQWDGVTVKFLFLVFIWCICQVGLTYPTWLEDEAINFVADLGRKTAFQELKCKENGVRQNLIHCKGIRGLVFGRYEIDSVRRKRVYPEFIFRNEKCWQIIDGWCVRGMYFWSSITAKR